MTKEGLDLLAGLTEQEYVIVYDQTKGIKFWTAKEYQSLTTQTTGYRHINFGNFFSEVEPHNLCDRIHDLLIDIGQHKTYNLGGIRLKTTFNVADKIDYDNIGNDQSYIVNEGNGTRIYVHDFADIPREFRPFAYESLISQFIEGICKVNLGGSYVDASHALSKKNDELRASILKIGQRLEEELESQAG